MFGTTLERDLKGDTSGHFLRLLVSICTASRSEDPNVNQAMAADDAKKLHSAGNKIGQIINQCDGQCDLMEMDFK